MDRVTVWLVRTDRPGRVTARLRQCLDSEELRRAAAMPDQLRSARYVVAHAALREIVGARLGVEPRAVRWERGAHGKPEPAGAGVRISLSTCDRLALVAVCGTRAVGVDVERLPADRVALRLAARHFPAAEAEYVAAAPNGVASRFTTLWSRKEACVKARGGRLAEGMRLVVRGPTPLLVGAPASTTTCLLHDFPVPRHHRAAVSLLGAAPFTVTSRLWQPGLPQESFTDV